MKPATNKKLAMVVHKNPTVVLKPIASVGDQFFIRLASEIKGNLPAPKLATIAIKLEAWADSLEAFIKNIKDRRLAFLQEHGTQVSDKGSLEYEEDGWILSARPWRTGYDEKKIEALLRAKTQDIGKWMDAEVRYKVNDVKLGSALQAGVLTQDELETCRYLDKEGKVIMAVQKPKRAEGGAA